ncbi:uncharacterized protein apol [Echeneis naucrates]|uniref:Uncharacterized LOC115047668 n=1 Tax=Echeneis naucrates TaxID=173247 RepID=A0A665TTV5_ECHNA|nr:uncharacterized protein LOC115047668 [Echeneis naucrates]XP_029364617.1 uncharacterized protein LOC115047668 [Echeneis naucrates]
MAAARRRELREALYRYATDTFTYLDTVKGFYEMLSKWELRRETELNMMMDIKQRADKINLGISHVTRSQKKGKAMLDYMASKATQITADRRRAELVEELAAVLKDMLGGLEELYSFLDAVEKLAVTSLHVFTENQMLRLPEGISFEHVQIVISAARLVCPYLLVFKRDAQVFFLPKLQNLEVLSYQLDRYIQTMKKMCEKLDKSCFSGFCPEVSMESLVHVSVGLSEDNTQKLLNHINQLDEIRMSQHFRTVFMFREDSGHGFLKEFSKRQPGMLDFLKELEQTSVKIDRMNKGAKISSVAGSSVGAVGGVLSIVGLALIPVTAGVSLALTMTGIGLGITSGVNSAITTATELGVNVTQQKKASRVMKSFVDDVEALQNCLEEVITTAASKLEMAVEVGKVVCKAGLVGKNIDALVDAASAAKLVKTEEVIADVGKIVAQEGKALRNVPRAAADIPDIGQAAVKGPLALSKSARAGLIAVNALFLGMDIFFICKDSISLAKGTEAEISQFIRARAALWSTELNSWQKIHDSVIEGLLTSEKDNAILEMPFYEVEMEVNKVVPRDKMDGRKCIVQ